MNSIDQVKYFARAPHAFPGGYPMFAICDDGGCLCHKCVKDNYRIIRESQRDNCRDGWGVEAVTINYEDSELYCDNCNDAIESAYGGSE
jgi:hypothetical protein